MKKILSALIISLNAVLLSACSQGAFFAANLPQYFSDVTIKQNVAFGDKPIEKLDIYIPEKADDRAKPVVVFLHGGRWADGTKEDYRFVGLKMAKYGYITVIPDYSKYPDVKFPVFVEDSAKALAWTHDHISEYGGDTSKIYLLGHSSGAHIAGLVAANPEYLGAFEKDRNIIAGFAGLAGPYAFVPEEEDLKDMFGPPERYPEMRTNTFIDGKQPPMLLMHGNDDDLVSTQNAYKVQKAAAEKGGEVIVKTYDGYDHTDLMRDFTWIGSEKSPVIQDILTFLKK